MEVSSDTNETKFYSYSDPIESGKLEVSPIHKIYWEISGNLNGPPVIYIHGGPGYKSTPSNRGYFDPEYFKIILFDQRGCGQSEPYGCLQDNNTWKTLDDIEMLRKFLKIEKFHILFGESWGTTLACLYAERNPDKISNLILRGIFLGTKKEIYNLYDNSLFHPVEFDMLRNALPEGERNEILLNYWKHLNGEDLDIKRKLIKYWTYYSMCLIFYGEYKEVDFDEGDRLDELPMIKLEMSYLLNNYFLERDNQIVEDAYKIKDIPTVILQSRYDCMTPILFGYEFYKKLTNAKFEVIQFAGHDTDNDESQESIKIATDSFKK